MELHIGDRVKASPKLVRDYPHLSTFVFRVIDINESDLFIWVELFALEHSEFVRYGLKYPKDSLSGVKYLHKITDLVKI